MKQKFIRELSVEEKKTLTECLNKHKKSRVRQRAHWLLLNSRGYTIDELSKLYESDRDTVSFWLSSWETKGIAGLFDEYKDGRPRKLSPDEEKQLVEELKQEPRSVKRLAALSAERFGKPVSTETIKRLLRRLGQKWKRAKAIIRQKASPAVYEQACHELVNLQIMASQNQLRLFYFDASGFSLVPSIPYCWQPKGDTLGIPANRSCRINVVGFMDLKSDLTPYVIDGRVDSEIIISCFENFIQQLDEDNVWIVLDNASIHRSDKFKTKASQWKQRGINLFYLPPYSPELNKIEILWRFIKYQWLSLKSYLSFDNLKDELTKLLTCIGSKYRITFV